MINKSHTRKITLSLATVVVLLGIMALYTGAQPTSTKPAEKPAAPATASETKKEEVKPAVKTEVVTPAAPSTAEVSSYLEAYGWMVGQQAGFEMGFTAEEKTALLKGLQRAADGAGAPEDMKSSFLKMQEYLSAKEKVYREKLAEKTEAEAKVHKADGEKFMKDIATQAGVLKTSSGLYYKIATQGEGKKPAADDVVSIHYTGKLIDGTVFDSSVERGAPVDLPLFGVIPGFSEGLQLLNEGGKATLYIPSELGYGNQAAGPIPPGSTLVFEVELIKIQPKPAPAAESTTEVKAEAKAVTQK